MKDKKFELSIAKVLGIIVIVITAFMSVNTISYIIFNFNNLTSAINIINTIITVIYTIFMIFIDIAIVILLFRYNESNGRLKIIIFHLSTLLLAFFISVLQEKLGIAYLIYFLVVVYFLSIFLLIKDVFKKKEINVVNKEVKKKSNYISTIILIVIILVIILSEIFNYINLTKLSAKYNQMNSYTYNVTSDTNENIDDIEENTPEYSFENFNNLLKQETLWYIIRISYLSIAILILILSIFTNNSKIKIINDSNLWILLFISAIMAHNFAIYYILQLSIVLYNIGSKNNK